MLRFHIAPPHYEPPSAEDYNAFSSYLKTNVHAFRVMEFELMQLKALRDSIDAKKLADESIRLSFSYLDGQIETYTGLISGEFVPPPAVDENPEGN